MHISEWNQRYRGRQPAEEHFPAPLVSQFVSGLAAGRALDLACGAGRHSLYLAGRGWDVTAVDGAGEALKIVEQRAKQIGVRVNTVLADLAAGDFVVEPAAFDLVLVCYYLQRSLFPAILQGTRPGGIVIAIVHIPEGDQDPNETRAAPGELRELFTGWRILHDFEGAPHDPAHKRLVAEIVAQRIL